MESGRITFEGNPWPEGHAINSFVWKSCIRDGDVYFQLGFETENYYAERHISDDGIESMSDWDAPYVWSNYHQCIVTPNIGFLVCPAADFSPEHLVSRAFKIDTLPFAGSVDNLHFHIYLLGHDSVADHTIRFMKRDDNEDVFDISWWGKIALTYAGDAEYKHTFKALINGVKMPILETIPQ